MYSNQKDMEKQFTYSEDEVKQIIQQTINHTWSNFPDNLRGKVATELYEKLRKKEQQVFYRVCNENTLRGLNGYIDKGWVIANMIPMTVSTGNNSYYTGKVCFLLEKEK